jgi:hypothetical protein
MCNDLIGNRTRNLPVRSVLSQSNTLSPTPDNWAVAYLKAFTVTVLKREIMVSAFKWVVASGSLVG